MSHSARISLHDSAPGLLKSMTALSMTVMKSSIGVRLIELVQLRKLTVAAFALTCTGASCCRKMSIRVI